MVAGAEEDVVAAHEKGIGIHLNIADAESEKPPGAEIGGHLANLRGNDIFFFANIQTTMQAVIEGMAIDGAFFMQDGRMIFLQ